MFGPWAARKEQPDRFPVFTHSKYMKLAYFWLDRLWKGAPFGHQPGKTPMSSTRTITGTQANQYTANDLPASRFSGVVVSNSLPGQIETVTINVLPAGYGLLSNLGIGSYDAATGVYTVVGPPRAS